tara:strand:+ start:529 stop:1251 length:723 start_codon:yes stop_codon:yes gene_type:complete
MSNISFENFATLGKNNLNLSSGRTTWMKKKIKYIVKDISSKLNFKITDNFLDVGCGDSKILKCIKPKVKSATGIDHYLIIKKIKKKINNEIKFISGDIKKDHSKIKKKYEKILIYSVVHYFKNQKELFKVIKILLSKLNISGMLLIGDIPNIDMKKRFEKSAQYKKIHEKWLINIKNTSQKEKKILNSINKDRKLVLINDKLIFKISKMYNNKKFECHVFNQDKSLLQNNTRLDILIKKI